MKVRLLSLLIALGIMLSLVSVSAAEAPVTTITTHIAMAEESADNFAARMKETYGVNIYEDIPATPAARKYVENALAFIGKEVIDSITGIRNLDIHFKAKKIILHLASAEAKPVYTMLHCMRVSQVQRLYMSLCML